jgi:hypothetical protein
MKKIRFFGIAIAAGLFFCNTTIAQKAKFEALYIYNLCRYIEWPQNFNSTSFVIGLVGNNSSLESELNSIASTKTIQGKKVIVKNISNASNSADCNIVFFTEGTENQLGNYFTSAKNALFIAESTVGIQKGADINFFIEENKLKFDFGVTNLSRKSLKYSNDLKQLASKTI